MNKQKSYKRKIHGCIMLIMPLRVLFVHRILLLFVLLFIFSPTKATAKDRYTGEGAEVPFVYDEIPVDVYVDHYGSFEIDIIYVKPNYVFVNVEDLFKNLGISCIPNSDHNLVGFIENESRPYVIDFYAKQINVGSKKINTQNGLIKEIGAIYIESSLLSSAFGLSITFNYRSLSAKLISDFELPIVRQKRLENTRKTISKLQGKTLTVDTVANRNYHLFKFGTLDWGLGTFQIVNEAINNRYMLGVGAELLYGEVNISFDYNDYYKFDHRLLRYNWQWVDNDQKFIKQAQVGKISTQTIAFINSPVIGATIRNTPTTIRKASGNYPVSGHTGPSWTVELYINDILVDYTKADASGLYVFNVPNVYGYTKLKFKFFSPLGEEQSEERIVNLPYSILPAKEFEYTISGGILQDNFSSRFGKGELNYGLNRLITIGGGMEYLSSITTGVNIPYVKATFQPISTLTINGEYAYGVRTRGSLSYYFWENAQLGIDYTKYTTGQRATLSNAPEERKLRLMLPIRIKSISGYAQVNYTQLIYNEYIFNQGSMIFSVYYKQFSANSSTQINWIMDRSPYLTSDLSLSYRLKNGFKINTSASYNVYEGGLVYYKAEIEKNIKKGYLSISYQDNILYHDYYVSVGFKYALPFARTNVSVSHSRGRVMTSAAAQGSLAFAGNNYTHFSNNSSASKGGILLYPFLDMNHNGIFDMGEHLVKVNTIKISGAKAIFSEKDSIIRIPDLNAFTSYSVAFDDNSLENIAWRFKNKTYQVLIDPNQFKRVDIPVRVVGEANGTAYLKKNNSLQGIGRILINIYKKGESKAVTEILSESDGYIYFLGLEPGEYFACVDSVQLSNLGYSAEPLCKYFSIRSIEAGDIVDGLNFILRPDTEGSIQQKEKETGFQAENDTVEISPSIENPLLIETVQKPAEKQTGGAEPTTLPIADTTEAVNNNDEQSYFFSPWKVNGRPPSAAKTNKASKPKAEEADPFSIVKDSINYFPIDTLYKVQVLALRNPLKKNDHFKKLQAAFPGLTISELPLGTGFYRYQTGAFRSEADARALLRKIRTLGWKDSFFVKYNPGAKTENTYHLKYNRLNNNPGNTANPKPASHADENTQSDNLPDNLPGKECGTNSITINGHMHNASIKNPVDGDIVSEYDFALTSIKN